MGIKIMKENNLDPYSKVGDGLELLQNIGKGRLIGVAGDDADLLYYYQCQDCGGVVVVDHREYSSSEFLKLGCPECNPELYDIAKSLSKDISEIINKDMPSYSLEYIPKDKISDSLQFRLDQGYY
ncbi:MAG: hypothetical protein KAT28_05185 [Candidatus Aenigmarchaeota archaeon]|nr:hypothetical protein [Candidatus Aenigmarchaeota archaeon]